MKVRCILVDDEPLATQLLQTHINQIPPLTVVGVAANAVEAVELLTHNEVDLLFLDIQMPMLTGIEFLRSLSNPPKVIFTTAYREYAMEGYELDVIDYLLKPITFERFFKAFNKYLDQSSSPENSRATVTNEPAGEGEHIFVNVNKKNIKVSFSKVLFIESLKDYLRIHLDDGTLVTKEKISEFELKLPNLFLRVHRSYIVNKSKITAYTATDVEIGRREIPIGGSYKRGVIDELRG